MEVSRTYCDDVVFEERHFVDFEDDAETVFPSGCGVVFRMDDIDRDDLSFGFHVELGEDVNNAMLDSIRFIKPASR